MINRDTLIPSQKILILVKTAVCGLTMGSVMILALRARGLWLFSLKVIWGTILRIAAQPILLARLPILEATESISDSIRSSNPVEPVNGNQQAVTPATQSQPLVSGLRGPIDGANRADGSIYASGTVYGDPLAPSGRNAIRTAPPIPDLPRPARSTPSSLINFGDNSSVWADDGKCDDPRFAGAGRADYVFDVDIMKDAND